MTTELERLFARRAKIDVSIRRAQISAEPDPWKTRCYHEFPKRALAVSAVSGRTILFIAIPDNDVEPILDGGARLGAIPLLRTPCPCGHHGDCYVACQCSAAKILRHQSKQPATDMFVIVPPLPADYKVKQGGRFGSSLEGMPARIARARTVVGRYEPNDAMQKMELQAVRELNLGVSEIELFRSLAIDIGRLDGLETPHPEHLCEALQYRRRSY